MSDTNKRWLVSLIATGILAIGGWFFGAVQSANAQSQEYMLDRIDESDNRTNEFVQEFKGDIREIKTDLKYTKDALKFILDKIGAN